MWVARQTWYGLRICRSNVRGKSHRSTQHHNELELFVCVCQGDDMLPRLSVQIFGSYLGFGLASASRTLALPSWGNNTRRESYAKCCCSGSAVSSGRPRAEIAEKTSSLPLILAGSWGCFLSSPLALLGWRPRILPPSIMGQGATDPPQSDERTLVERIAEKTSSNNTTMG